jgi:excisionase family DNA binding protein
VFSASQLSQLARFATLDLDKSWTKLNQLNCFWVVVMGGHIHAVAASTTARTLLIHKTLDVSFCECGAFRLNGSQRWTKPLEPELTRVEAARYLNVSLMTITRLGKQLHGKRVAGWRGHREWRFSRKQLDRFRFKEAAQ